MIDSIVDDIDPLFVTETDTGQITMMDNAVYHPDVVTGIIVRGGIITAVVPRAADT